MSEVKLHTPEAHDVITCELVACALGQRSRMELRVDSFAAQFAAIARAFDAMQAHIGWALVKAMRSVS